MPKWTKQHFEAVAKEIASAGLSAEQKRDLYQKFTEFFLRKNDNFDPDRFHQLVFKKELTK